MINIAEILKNAPMGLKLYSPVFGGVEFVEVDEKALIWCVTVRDSTGCLDYFDETGRCSNIGDCCLFPSEDHQSWEGWQEVLIPQCVGSVIILASSYNNYEWIVTNNGMFAVNMYLQNNTQLHLFEEMNFKDMRFASPKEAELFFERLNKLGYKFENGEVVVKDLKNMGCKSWCKYDANDGDFIRTYELETIIFSRISNGCVEGSLTANKNLIKTTKKL